MTDSSEWIWIRIRRRAAMAIAGILREAATKLHFEATVDKSRAKALREVADESHYIGKQIERSLHWGAQGDSVNIQASERSNLNSTNINEGNIKVVPWLVLSAVLSGFALATSIFLMIEFAQIQNDMARMSVHVMSNDALLLREGILQPGDKWYGPEGNLEYGRKDKPKEK